MRVCPCGVGFSMEGIPLAFALLQTLVAPDSRWRRGVADVLSRRTSQWSYAGEWYAVGVRLDHPTHGVEMAGELDVAYRDEAVHACTLPDQEHVVVGLANVTFMDCSGCGALVHARTVFERCCGSLSLTGRVSEPLSLFSLIDHGFRDSSWLPLEFSPVPSLVVGGAP